MGGLRLNGAHDPLRKSDRQICQGSSRDLFLVAESGARSIGRGTIISFHTPPAVARYCAGGGGGLGVKRVIGLPGDRVVERRGLVFVDGRRLPEPYVPRRERDDLSGSWRVPAHSYFVMGDDRIFSCDSRKWGSVRAAAIVGQVKTIFRAGDGEDPVGPPIVHVPYQYQSIPIVTPAMEPTLRCYRSRNRFCTARSRDLALEERSGARGLGRGDVIYFRLPAAAAPYCGGGDAIERVIGLPGEDISETNGRVKVDGKSIAEPYVPKSERDDRSGSWHDPKGSYFVMADYRSKSCDSRVWGPVRRSNILGRIVEILRLRAAR